MKNVNKSDENRIGKIDWNMSGNNFRAKLIIINVPLKCSVELIHTLNSLSNLMERKLCVFRKMFGYRKGVIKGTSQANVLKAALKPLYHFISLVVEQFSQLLHMFHQKIVRWTSFIRFLLCAIKITGLNKYSLVNGIIIFGIVYIEAAI